MSGIDREDALTQAIDRWVDALNAPTDPSFTDAAFAADGVIERCGVHEVRGDVLDVYTGHEAIATWVARVPPPMGFVRTSEVTEDPADASVAAARYRITIADFVGGGLWRFRVARDGRISWLHHQPDDLPSWTEDTEDTEE